ncbi:MAG: class I SAM-dependent methyltransferase [Acidimicrobiia bacterium]
MSFDPKRIVADGYDAIFDRYEHREEEQGDGVRGARIDSVLPLVPSRRSALDLGCGTGTKATARLAREFDAVTAVDISRRSIDAARQRVPGVEFLAGDMTRVEFPAEAFDLVTAFYSVLHVPAGEQPALVARVASWLVLGGVFLFDVGLHPGDEHEDDWLGAPMYWSSLGRDATLAMVTDAGLLVVASEVETKLEDGREANFLWVTAQRGGNDPVNA